MSARDFYGGVIAALALVAAHDEETLYREIVKTMDKRALVRRAKEEGDEEWCGLVRYKYARRRKVAA